MDKKGLGVLSGSPSAVSYWSDDERFGFGNPNRAVDRSRQVEQSRSFRSQQVESARRSGNDTVFGGIPEAVNSPFHNPPITTTDSCSSQKFQNSLRCVNNRLAERPHSFCSTNQTLSAIFIPFALVWCYLTTNQISQIWHQSIFNSYLDIYMEYSIISRGREGDLMAHCQITNLDEILDFFFLW
jgi:hypothetical protein